MMIAASILVVTLLLAAMIASRYLSPAFRERMELPKYRFQASLGRTPQETKENNDVKSE
jgi:hypothetical protein